MPNLGFSRMLPASTIGQSTTRSLGVALVVVIFHAQASFDAEAADTPAMSSKTCASEPVFASGEEASYEWLARIKAHANWRAKVRVMPGLGDPYANWQRAEDTTERCFSGPAGTVCQFTGIPCRKK
ncbi:MAG: hypothetical protein APF80_01315 [Alphaproteobacteria bacterium BRH_c36]|nr:MAG: hypothetical protein APF80_01315 [Alphaproteobacteria bacterium BRH_c36]